MRWKTVRNNRGLTLIELMAGTVMSTIVMFSIGVVLVDSQRSWDRMYNRVYDGLVTDGYTARKAFDAAVRKSSIKRARLGDDEVEVYYYDDPETSTRLDRYARFYVTDRKLMVDHGELDADGNPQGTPSTVTLARNVEAVNFSVTGVCVQMTLSLDNGSESVTVMASPVRHNE